MKTSTQGFRTWLENEGILSLDWSKYDNKVMATGNNKRRISVEKKKDLEELAASIAGVNSSGDWGEVLGYGNDAIAVIRVKSPHRYNNYVDGDIAVKILDKSPEHYLNFHQKFKLVPEALEPLRTNYFQKTIDTGISGGHSYQVLTYLPGENLEDTESIESAKDAINGFFTNIIIPSWNVGHRFFDFRNANLIHHQNRISLIDLDMVSKGFGEIGSDEWAKRDVLERTAFGRMPGIVEGIISKSGLKKSKAKIKKAFEESGLKQSLALLGRGGKMQDSVSALDYFLAKLFDEK
ncbi:MAG: hypothetical protein ACW99G_12050 [Candidatus Thorarchaeota archaeon]|jgi:hypothetical protein